MPVVRCPSGSLETAVSSLLLFSVSMVKWMKGSCAVAIYY